MYPYACFTAASFVTRYWTKALQRCKVLVYPAIHTVMRQSFRDLTLMTCSPWCTIYANMPVYQYGANLFS